jgi:molecular chaperone GrpE (heat shock protein)
MSDQTHNPQTEDTNIEETLQEIVSEGASSPPKTDAIDEVTRLKDALARSQADYQNLVMRNERDKIEMMSYLSAKLVTPLLKEVDNLERAVKLKE